MDEEQRLIQLQESRKLAEEEEEAQKKLKKIPKTKHKINIMEAILMFSIASVADLADWLIIGSIPIIGDVLDFIMVGIIGFWALTLLARKYNLPFLAALSPVGALGIELVPFVGDIPPSWIGAVWIIYWKSYK